MRTGLVAIALLATVACGSSETSNQPSVGRVTLEVSGGFTGWARILTVESDGTARVQVLRGPSPSAGTLQLDADVLSRLHDLVSDPAFAQLAPAYVPPQPGADLQDYTVTAEVGGRTLKTMARDGASPPPVLREVLSILNGVLAAAG